MRTRRAVARLLMVIGMLTVLALLAGLIFSPQLVDRASRRAFANMIPPDDGEYPPTSFSPALSSVEVGGLAGRSEGLNCSITPPVRFLAFRGEPGGLASVNLRYRQACVAHDLCYRHGAATYGYTQSDCDAQLVRDAFRLCRQVFRRSDGDRSAVPVDRCMAIARRVYAGVVLGGADSFRRLDTLPGRAGKALMEVSTPVEFQPYLLPQASLAAPRVVIDGSGTAALLYIRHRPGGEAYVRYGWDSGRFVKREEAFLPSRYDTVPALPMVVASSAGDALLWWRRDQTETFATGGVFEIAAANELGKLPKETPQPHNRNERPDPTAQLLVPVKGRSPDGRIHLVGIAAAGGNGRCGGYRAKRAFKLVHLSLDFSKTVQAPGSVECMTYGVTSATFNGPERGRSKRTGFDTRDTDSYRYIATAPSAHFIAGGIEIVAYRRGDSSGSGFQEQLMSARVEIPVSIRDRTTAELNAEERCWAVPETAEPVVPVRDDKQRTISLAGVNSEGSRSALAVYAPSPLDRDGCHMAPGVHRYRLKGLGEFSQLRMAAFDIRDLGLSSRLDAGLALVGARLTGIKQTASRRSDGDQKYNIAVDAVTLLVGGRDGARAIHSRLGLWRTADTPGALAQRIAGIVPIITDMSGDGIPDLLLADVRKGSRSVLYAGSMPRPGVLIFQESVTRTQAGQNKNADEN